MFHNMVANLKINKNRIKQKMKILKIEVSVKNKKDYLIEDLTKKKYFYFLISLSLLNLQKNEDSLKILYSKFEWVVKQKTKKRLRTNTNKNKIKTVLFGQNISKNDYAYKLRTDWLNSDKKVNNKK